VICCEAIVISQTGGYVQIVQVGDGLIILAFIENDDVCRAILMISQILILMTLSQLRTEQNMTRWLQLPRVLRLNMYVFLFDVKVLVVVSYHFIGHTMQ